MFGYSDCGILENCSRTGSLNTRMDDFLNMALFVLLPRRHQMILHTSKKERFYIIYSNPFRPHPMPWIMPDTQFIDAYNEADSYM
jgi:hypothetical protein